MGSWPTLLALPLLVHLDHLFVLLLAVPHLTTQALALRQLQKTKLRLAL